METIHVNELSAYEFTDCSTYGTTYGGSILVSTHLDVLSMLMLVIFTLTSVALVHSVRHFSRGLHVVLTDSNDEHALIR